MPALSVILPTHRRPAILARSLAALSTQTARSDLEVIVVSDGPDDEARSIASAASAVGLPVRYDEVPKSHQGVARNRGVAMATAPRVLFVQDDIMLAPDACAVHLDAAARHPGAAVLGFVTWDPTVGVTPVMRWLEECGWQFGYPQLTPYAGGVVPRASQHRYTYTAHISLPTQVALAHRFREDVTLYGWEDIEWGRRLAEAGVPLIYEPAAKALHHHRLTEEDSLKRMETLGRSAVLIERLAPGFRAAPHGWKAWLYPFIAMLPTRRGRHARAFLRGIDSAKKA